MENKKWLIVFGVLIALLILYVAFDLWAVSKVTPVMGSTGVWSSLVGLSADFDESKTYVEGSIKLSNPTIMPVLFSGLSYQVFYGDVKIADGETGYLMFWPNSERNISFSLKVDNKQLFASIKDQGTQMVKKVVNKVVKGITGYGNNEKNYVLGSDGSITEVSSSDIESNRYRFELYADLGFTKMKIDSAQL